jgi:hypothetical protein
MFMLAKEEGLNPTSLEVKDALHLLQLLEYFISEDANHIQLGLVDLCEGLAGAMNPEAEFNINDLIKFMLRCRQCQDLLKKLSVKIFKTNLDIRHLIENPICWMKMTEDCHMLLLILIVISIILSNFF